MRHVTGTLRNPLFWLLVVFFLACVFLHYSPYIPFIPSQVGSIFNIEGHNIERVLFLGPIVLGGIFFGLRGGLAWLLLSLAAMLPQAFLISPGLVDALFESLAIVAIGGGFSWWLDSRRGEKGRREQALLKLEAVRRELQSYIQTIRDNEDRLSVLHSITTAINQLISLDDILTTAVDKIEGAVDVDGVLLYLLEEKTQELELKAYRGVSREFASRISRLKPGEGFNGSVAQTGEPSMIENSSTHPTLATEAVRAEGIGSQFIVPLLSGEKVVGTLSAFTHAVRHFAKEEQQLLILIGTELGVAVEKARLSEESRRVGERFRELFEKAHDAIWVQDFDGNILAANQAAADFTGYSLDEIIGNTVFQFLKPEGLELAREIRRKMLSGIDIEQPYEQKIVRKDGTEATIMLTTSLIAEAGMPPVFQHISRDVTREKQLQENLRMYARQITRAHEEERKRIARELHDDSIQSLVVLSRHIDDLMPVQPGSKEWASSLDKIRREIDETLSRMRRFTQDLRPPTLDYLGLLPALRELVSQLNQQDGIESDMSVAGAEQHFTQEDELLIYRIVQEALRNIWRHSKASRAHVSIEFNGDSTTVQISDNGIGFQIGENLKFVRVGKIGLAGMQERASLLGGSLDIASRPGQGTTVTLKISSQSLEKRNDTTQRR
jgi:PAS domain S-box-containing protein